MKREAFVGKMDKTFDFLGVHMGLKYKDAAQPLKGGKIQLKVDDRLIPTVAYNPNYKANKWIDGHNSLLDVDGKKYQDWSNGIKKDDYIGGSCLYGFILNNDSLFRHDSQNLMSHVNITMKFSEALRQTMTLIVYSSTQSDIIIDKNRNVILNGT